MANFHHLDQSKISAEIQCSLFTGKGIFDSNKDRDKYIGPKLIMPVTHIYVHRDNI